MASQKRLDKSQDEKKHLENKMEQLKYSPKGEEEEEEKHNMEDDGDEENDGYGDDENEEDNEYQDVQDEEEEEQKDKTTEVSSVPLKHLTQFPGYGQNFPPGSEPVEHFCPRSGTQPFICADCSQSSGWRWHLTRHRRTHTAERPYGCAACGESFSHKAALTQHHNEHY